MKVFGLDAGEPKRPSVTERMTFELAGGRLYWDHAADLLFAIHTLPDGHFGYEAINPAFEARLGVSSWEVRDLDISECMESSDAKSVGDALLACMARGAEVRIRHCLSLGGPRCKCETTVAPIFDSIDGIVVRVIGSHRILCEEPLGNGAPGRADEWGSVSLASIQEDIQRRIASDLHDSTCQHLIAASLGIMRVRAHLAGPIDAERLCDNIDASIDEALKEIRSFSYLLHPQSLTAEGLKATIERYAEGFAARTSLRISTRILTDVDRLSRDSQYALLRVTQEALTNVFRHAKATEVKIVIDATDGHFRLKISDNGRGFLIGDVRRGAKAGTVGVGIPAMRARLQQLGGTLDVQFNPTMRRAGTLLCAIVPCGAAMKRRNCRSRTDTVAAYRGPQ